MMVQSSTEMYCVTFQIIEMCLFLFSDEMTLKKLKESQTGKSRKSVKRREKIGKINQYIAHVQGLTEKNKGLLQPVTEELRLMRKHHVEKLVSNIFPVTDIQPRR